MSLVNFSESSLTQLKALIGSFGNEELEREFISSVPYVESRYFQVSSIVEKETEGGDKYNEYKAFEVLPDGTPVDDGIIFDSDATNTFKPANPVYFDNLRINELIFSGSVELGYAYQVEAVWPDDANGEIVYYIIPKGGGGFLYALIKSNIQDNIYNCDIYSEPLEEDSLKIQEDVQAVAYNVVYGEIPIGRFLPFTSGGNGGYITPSVWW